jgi:hypothetical protein
MQLDYSPGKGNHPKIVGGEDKGCSRLLVKTFHDVHGLGAIFRNGGDAI